MTSTDPLLSALRTLEHNLVERLGADMDRHFGAFGTEMNDRFDAIEKRLEHLEIEYQMIVAALSGSRNRSRPIAPTAVD